MEPEAQDHRRFIARLLIALGIVGLALLLWQLRDLLLLVFAAVLVAVILRLVARPVHERFGLPDGIALALAVLVVGAVLVSATWLFGAEVAAQTSALRLAIPAAWEALLERLQPWGLAAPLNQWVEGIGSGTGITTHIGRIAMSVGSGVADALLVLVGGIYLAAQPELYRTGLLKLIPARGRGLAAETLDDGGEALRLWLLGRLVSMTIVGLLTGLGLWLIGVPAALTLAIIAFILEFVPFIGPILASVPAILLALLQGPEMVLWTAGLYLVIQQIEGNIVEPLVQQKAVTLPPALLLFALVAGGLLFGTVGLLLAAPLLVVIYVAVKRLYVRETLHTDTPIPGEASD